MKISNFSSMLGRLMRRLHAPVYVARQVGLVAEIASHVRAGDRVLDVGCGGGALGAALMAAVPGVVVEGLERAPRPGAEISVTGFGGGVFPFADDAYDVVIVADVIHHDPEPLVPLAECLRVARRVAIVKDHKTDGLAVTLPWLRICVMDWLANVMYGIPCEFDYPTRAGWLARFATVRGRVVVEREAMALYPRPYRWVFTPRLQYLAVVEPGGARV